MLEEILEYIVSTEELNFAYPPGYNCRSKESTEEMLSCDFEWMISYLRRYCVIGISYSAECDANVLLVITGKVKVIRKYKIKYRFICIYN